MVSITTLEREARKGRKEELAVFVAVF